MESEQAEVPEFSDEDEKSEAPKFTEEQKSFIERKTADIYLVVLLGMTYDLNDLKKSDPTLYQESLDLGLDPEIAKSEMKKIFRAKVDSYFGTLDEKVRSELEQMIYIGPLFIDKQFEAANNNENKLD